MVEVKCDLIRCFYNRDGQCVRSEINITSDYRYFDDPIICRDFEERKGDK